MVKVKTPFRTEEEANKVAKALGVIDWMKDAVIAGNFSFTTEQEAEILATTETLNQYSPQEILLFIYWTQVGTEE
nr:hypothetical protein [Bacillus licheniformis]